MFQIHIKTIEIKTDLISSLFTVVDVYILYNYIESKYFMAFIISLKSSWTQLYAIFQRMLTLVTFNASVLIN